jgi:hypothetical protein
MRASVIPLDIALAILGLYFVKQLLSKKPPAPLPPGPKPLPLIGNFLDWPKGHDWVALAKWGEEYGKCFLPHIVFNHPHDLKATSHRLSSSTRL